MLLATLPSCLIFPTPSISWALGIFIWRVLSFVSRTSVNQCPKITGSTDFSAHLRLCQITWVLILVLLICWVTLNKSKGLIFLARIILVSNDLTLGLSRSEATIITIISNMYWLLTMCQEWCLAFYIIISLNLHNNPMRQAPLLNPFYRWENWCKQRSQPTPQSSLALDPEPCSWSLHHTATITAVVRASPPYFRMKSRNAIKVSSQGLLTLIMGVNKAAQFGRNSRG